MAGVTGKAADQEFAIPDERTRRLAGSFFYFNPDTQSKPQPPTAPTGDTDDETDRNCNDLTAGHSPQLS
jgi:hypothetical protein